jgi:iron complex outermembrane recepter protein
MSVHFSRKTKVLFGRGAVAMALCVSAQAQEASLGAMQNASLSAGIAAPLIPDEQQVEAPAPQTEGRAHENAVRQAEDAFGSTIGRESIGIYSADDVRGFSALTAGNARINGLFFDQIAGPSPRIRRSTSIRVGLSALNFPFPAPTGVVDYALIRPGAHAALSVTASADSYENAAVDFDFSQPIAGEWLAAGGGGSILRGEFVNGSERVQTVSGISVLWKPIDTVELQPFWTRTDTDDHTIAPLYAPAGDVLPPAISRRRFFGQEWAQFDGAAQLHGVLARARPSDSWLFEAGVFRSAFLTDRDTFVLLSDFQPDGSGQYLVFTDPSGKTASTSGEARLTYTFTDGARAHRLIASVRARERRQLFGGSDVRDYGIIRLDEVPRFPEPDFVFGEQSLDRVDQVSGGLTYAAHWKRIAELTLGVSKTEYSKQIARPGLAPSETASAPWLYNGAIAIDARDDLVIYAGYTRGLEESGAAPQNAINRNEAPQAIITSQQDAGIRWSIAQDLRLIAGVFDVRKPYFSVNAAGSYTQLGATRNRGIEASLSGKVTDVLTLVAGAVILDAEVTGEAVRLGNVGARPIGLARRQFDMNLDWTSPIPGVSLDLRVAHQSDRAATTSNSVLLPDRTLIDIGGRYRFQVGSTDMTLRILLSNAADVRGYELWGPGTYDLIDGRVVGAYLTADL